MVTKGKILHLNSYYFTNKLYRGLYKELERYCEQTIYIPIKLNVDLSNEDLPHSNDRVQYTISQIIKPYHKIFYKRKIKCLIRDLVERMDLKGVSVIHAHNVFVDGAIANYLFEKYNIPFIISVRMTDVSMQYKYMIHRRSFARKIMSNAAAIVFISAKYKELLQRMLPKTFRHMVDVKSLVIPNGIDNYWHKNIKKDILPFNERDGGAFKLIYVGQIIERKKVIILIEVIEKLRKIGYNFILTVVGGENRDEQPYYKKFLSQIEGKEFVDYRGKISNLNDILNCLREHHAFIMTPVNELFGVVYIEALSQSLPVIYSKNEGIDGYLSGMNCGVAVDPNYNLSIEEGIVELYRNYSCYKDLYKICSGFFWPHISELYVKLYSQIYNSLKK